MESSTIQKPDILSIIEKEVDLKQRGRNFVGMCPFHREKTPSFVVDSEKQRWRCFGACNEGGDVISFIQKRHGLSFPDALKYLSISGDSRKIKSDLLELKKRKLVKKFNRWILLYRRAISELLRLANRIALAIEKPEDLGLSGISEMYFRKFIYEYHLDILNGGCDEAKFKLYQEYLDGCNELHS